MIYTLYIMMNIHLNEIFPSYNTIHYLKVITIISMGFLMLWCSIVFMMVGALILLHIRLIVIGKTTTEFMRDRREKRLQERGELFHKSYGCHQLFFNHYKCNIIHKFRIQSSSKITELTIPNKSLPSFLNESTSSSVFPQLDSNNKRYSKAIDHTTYSKNEINVFLSLPFLQQFHSYFIEPTKLLPLWQPFDAEDEKLNTEATILLYNKVIEYHQKKFMY